MHIQFLYSFICCELKQSCRTFRARPYVIRKRTPACVLEYYLYNHFVKSLVPHRQTNYASTPALHVPSTADNEFTRTFLKKTPSEVCDVLMQVASAGGAALHLACGTQRRGGMVRVRAARVLLGPAVGSPPSPPRCGSCGRPPRSLHCARSTSLRAEASSTVKRVVTHPLEFHMHFSFCL